MIVIAINIKITCVQYSTRGRVRQTGMARSIARSLCATYLNPLTDFWIVTASGLWYDVNREKYTQVVIL